MNNFEMEKTEGLLIEWESLEKAVKDLVAFKVWLDATWIESLDSREQKQQAVMLECHTRHH